MRLDATSMLMKTAVSGFTLVELIITLAIASILASIAAPAFSDFVQDTRISSETNSIITDFYFARSEAVKRNRRVTICKSSNANSTDTIATPIPSCNTIVDFNWTIGWIIFIDTDGDGVRDANEVLLRANGGMDTGVLLYPRTADVNIRNYLSYNPRGIARTSGGANQNGIFRVCDGRGLASARAITVTQTGRVSSTAPTAGSAALIGACPPP